MAENTCWPRITETLEYSKTSATTCFRCEHSFLRLQILVFHCLSTDRVLPRQKISTEQYCYPLTKSSKSTQQVLPSMVPVTPGTKTTSWEPFKPISERNYSDTHEWVLPVSQSAQVFASEELFLKPISNTCKATVWACATVHEAMEFSDAGAIPVALPDFSLFSMC